MQQEENTQFMTIPPNDNTFQDTVIGYQFKTTRAEAKKKVFFGKNHLKQEILQTSRDGGSLIKRKGDLGDYLAEDYKKSII